MKSEIKLLSHSPTPRKKARRPPSARRCTHAPAFALPPVHEGVRHPLPRPKNHGRQAVAQAVGRAGALPGEQAEFQGGRPHSRLQPGEPGSRGGGCGRAAGLPGEQQQPSTGRRRLVTCWQQRRKQMLAAKRACVGSGRAAVPRRAARVGRVAAPAPAPGASPSSASFGASSTQPGLVSPLVDRLPAAPVAVAPDASSGGPPPPPPPPILRRTDADGGGDGGERTTPWSRLDIFSR